MLKWPILLTGLLVSPVTDTVWWRTTGGSVIEHRDHGPATCTLTIDNYQGSFAFVWDHDLPPRVMVFRQGWTLAPNQIEDVSIRIGGDWLGGGDGAPNITAMTGRSAIMFVANQPIELMLATASEIAVRTPQGEFGMSLVRPKMAALLAALSDCRSAIG